MVQVQRSSGLSADRGGRLLVLCLLLAQNQACRDPNPEFDDGDLRDDSTESREEKTDDQDTDDLDTEDETMLRESTGAGATAAETEDTVTAEQTTAEQTTDDSTGSSETVSDSSSESSPNSTTSEDTSTTSSFDYCGTGPDFCYLVDDQDPDGVIRNVRRAEGALVHQHGTITTGPPQLPSQVPALQVAQEGPAAIASTLWLPPFPDSLGFDVYAQLPSDIGVSTNIFAIHQNFFLVVGQYGLLYCSFADPSNPLNYTNTAGIAIPDTGWHHYACGFDGQRIQLWVDGQPGTRVPTGTSHPVSETNLQLGGNADLVVPANGNQTRDFGHFRGSLSAIRIWTDYPAFLNAMNP